LPVSLVLKACTKSFGLNKDELHDFFSEDLNLRALKNVLMGLAEYNFRKPFVTNFPFMMVWDVTYKCNLSCKHCYSKNSDLKTELSTRDAKKIIEYFAQNGILYISFAGGEPLMRKDIIDIVRRISPYVEEVSMTTNASRLVELACNLKTAGLARVNISLHSLNPKKFMEITGTDLENTVEAGIRDAIKCGLNPVKLNMVVMKDINHDEIDSLIEFSSKTGAVLQLIEFQELENGIEYYEEFHYDLVPVEKKLTKCSKKIIEREMHRRKIYYLESGAQVEVVRPMHNSTFCTNCTRLRVTSDGKLKACLMRDDNLVPLVSLIRKGEPYEALVDAFKKAVSFRKPYWKE